MKVGLSYWRKIDRVFEVVAGIPDPLIVCTFVTIWSFVFHHTRYLSVD